MVVSSVNNKELWPRRPTRYGALPAINAPVHKPHSPTMSKLLAVQHGPQV